MDNYGQQVFEAIYNVHVPCSHLRIGNWVKWRDEVYRVKTISENAVTLMDCYCKDEIPINEIIALPIGRAAFYSLEHSDCFQIEEVDNIIFEILFSPESHPKRPKTSITSIRFVHELQNIYFSLLGKELELELND